MKFFYSFLFLAVPTLGSAAITSFEHNGHGYIVDNTDGIGLTWDGADAAATAMIGGVNGVPTGWANPHLVVINTAAENTAVLNGINSLGITTYAPDGGGGAYAWLGANDTDTEGNFNWVDGSPFWTGGQGGSASGGAYENWGSYVYPNGNPPTYEPDDFGAGQDHVAISTTGWPLALGIINSANPGEWNDLDGGNQLAYVVEFDVVPEPSSSLMVLLGSLMFIRRQR